MRRRHLWLLLAVALGVLLGYWWNRRPRPVPPAVPPPVAAKPAPASAPTHPEVPIQEGKTIDFSSGKPVVKESAEDQAAIAAAKKEMDEATKDITFEPNPPPKKKD
ncbi:MAG: hypothetical protein JSR48_12710 [Verrucomicrobia bacterium]|nr:hypothetical protein [Verrucomicrobiota bacterium]